MCSTNLEIKDICWTIEFRFQYLNLELPSKLVIWKLVKTRKSHVPKIYEIFEENWYGFKTNNQIKYYAKSVKTVINCFKKINYCLFWKILKDKNIQQLQGFMYREIYGILKDKDVVFLADEWWFAECCSDQQNWMLWTFPSRTSKFSFSEFY